MMGPYGYSQSGAPQGDMAAALVNNPISVLLTPDRHAILMSLSDTERQLFYGRVMEAVFSNPTYQQIMVTTANHQLDQLAALRGGAGGGSAGAGGSTGGGGGSMGGGAMGGGGSMGGGATGNGSIMLA